MEHDNREVSGIVGVVSRQAGAVAGTSVVISKKIADCGVKSVTTAKDWLEKPLKTFIPAKGKKRRVTPQTSVLKSMDKAATDRKKAAKALIASLESDLVAAQHELKEVQTKAEQTKSQLTSQLSELQTEKKSLVTEFDQTRTEAEKATDKVKTQVTVLESDLTTAQKELTKEREKKEFIKPQQPSDQSEEKVDVISTEKKAASKKETTIKKEKQPFHKPRKDKVMASKAVAVTDEEVQAAVFPHATDKIIFARALSDIVNKDASIRANAARTLAGIRHGLSVKTLVVQAASDSSPRVRQECIKGLTVLEMKEGLPAIKHALADEVGSVRLASVWGLYRLAGAESITELTRMFSDEDNEVRRRAVTCAGWLGQKELAVELLPLMNDNSVSVCRAAIEAMGNLHSWKVVSSLIERLNTPNESIRKTVLRAIETITGKKMSKSFPKNESEFERVIARWQEWWKEEILG